MIRVNQLNFTYPGSNERAVKDVSFELDEGEIFGFLGPSGAGKSTTQKVLIRLLKGFEGDIQVMGKSLQNWREDFYEHIGVGFELPNHYTKLSAIENLQFFGSFYKRTVRKPQELLEMVGLGDDGDKKISEYSKGMKMRLNFVRSFMHDPELLFFDEPTSGLDPGNARIVKDIIMDLKKQGKTIFLTTHDMTVADQLCDRLAFMVDGKLALIDAPQSLKMKHGNRQVKVEYGNKEVQAAAFDLDKLGQDESFLRIIREEKLHTIHSEEATLENIFIDLTGQSLK